MRTAWARGQAADLGADLLSTGEAAALLGVSRQHVVDLCDEGLLTHSWAGKHRRLVRRDVETWAAGTGRLTRDQTRSLLLAHAIAGHIAGDPDGARDLARRNLQRMRDGGARGSARVWILEWEKLLAGPVIDLLTTLTSPSPRSRELRQNNPFAGVLTEAERQQVLEAARSTERR